MTAIVTGQGLTSRKTTIEDRDLYIQTTNLSIRKWTFIKTIQALYSFLFLKSKSIHAYSM